MYRSQVLALKYFTAAITLFGVMTLTGLVSSYYYVNAEFLFGILPFNIAKILHINTLVLWLLIGFMGSIYWFLPQELGRETAGVWAADLLFMCFARLSQWSRSCLSSSNTAAAPKRRCGLSIRDENMSKRHVGRPLASS